MSRGRLNPYKLGIELLRDIEHRWNTGKFGKEYDECDDLEKRRNWDKQLGLGRQKIFEVRRVHNDITFIDTFLTPEFCVRAQDVLLRLAGAGGQLRDRVARIRENQATAAIQLDELRQTVDLCSRRQLPQPRRTAAAAPAQRRRTAPRPGGRHPGEHPVHLGPAGASCRRSSMASPPCFPSTAPNTASKPEERAMTLDELLLQKLAKWRPDSDRQTLMFPTRTAAGPPPSPPNAWTWSAAGSGSWPCAAPPRRLPSI